MSSPLVPLQTAITGPLRLAQRGSLTLATAVREVLRAQRLERSDHRGRAACFQAVSRAFVRHYGIQLDVTGALPPGPSVIVMNHLGYVDPLVAGALAPVAPIAKSEVGNWPFVGTVGHGLGVMFIRRGDPHSGFRVLRQAKRVLHSGGSVLNFPEGTTTDGDQVLPFHRGIFGIARHLGVPVVPVRMVFARKSLSWVGDDAFVPHFVDFAASSRRERVELHIRAPIDPAAFPTAEGLAAAARTAIAVDGEPLRLAS